MKSILPKLIILVGAALALVPAASSASEFSLEFKTLTAREVGSFPVGPGVYLQASINKPAGIAREPAAASRLPLYGTFGEGTNAVAFRLDESPAGRGYDRLIMDLNRNRDLTDDWVIAPATNSAAASSAELLFGPFPAPGGVRIGDGQPVLFAECYFYPMPPDAGTNMPVRGWVRLMPGWYLETTAEFDGVKRKVGLVDANCNSRLADIATPDMDVDMRDGQTNWYFSNGDLFLQDVNNSGKFQKSSTNPEHYQFYPLVYAGAKPCKVVLSADARTLSVEPWSEPLAELSFQPHGGQVGSVQLALESAPGKWQLLQANVTDGKTRVPPGNYRLFICTLKDKTAAGDTLVLTGVKYVPEGGVRCLVGTQTPFKCGAPLETRITSKREIREPVPAGGSSTLQERLARNAAQPEEPLTQRIDARLFGAGGEIYNGFDLVKKGGRSAPAKPVFTVLSADGKTVASGTMEYG